MDKLDRISRHFNGSQSGYVGVTGWDLYQVIFKRELFENFLEIPFEDMMVQAPVCYDEILKTIYGNYMQLPPENERISHHDYKTYRRD